MKVKMSIHNHANSKAASALLLTVMIISNFASQSGNQGRIKGGDDV